MPRRPIKVGLPEGVTFTVGPVVRTALIQGPGWAAKVELEARSPAAMDHAVRTLADLYGAEVESRARPPPSLVND